MRAVCGANGACAARQCEAPKLRAAPVKPHSVVFIYLFVYLDISSIAHTYIYIYIYTHHIIYIHICIFKAYTPMYMHAKQTYPGPPISFTILKQYCSGTLTLRGFAIWERGPSFQK